MEWKLKIIIVFQCENDSCTFCQVLFSSRGYNKFSPLFIILQLGSKGQNSDRQTYYIEDEFNIDLG